MMLKKQVSREQPPPPAHLRPNSLAQQAKAGCLVPAAVFLGLYSLGVVFTFIAAIKQLERPISWYLVEGIAVLALSLAATSLGIFFLVRRFRATANLNPVFPLGWWLARMFGTLPPPEPGLPAGDKGTRAALRAGRDRGVKAGKGSGRGM